MDDKIEYYLEKYKAMYSEIFKLQDERNDIRKTNPERADLLQKIFEEKKVNLMNLLMNLLDISLISIQRKSLN